MTDERYKCKLSMFYDARDTELVLERKKCRELICQLNLCASTYVQTSQVPTHLDYFEIRKQALPKLAKTCRIDLNFYADYGYNIIGGEDALIGANCAIMDAVPVEIGRKVYFGPNCTITTTSHPEDPYLRVDHGQTISEPIKIGDYVWLCSNVVVCPGVKIGNNVIVGAGSVVLSDIPDNCIAAGAPAKVIHHLKPKQTENGTVLVKERVKEPAKEPDKERVKEQVTETGQKTKIDKFERTELCQHIPEKLEPGVIYVSGEFGSIQHLCPCGCGTPINIGTKPHWPTGFDYKVNDDNTVTVSPSLLNKGCPNQAHYFITNNRIVWC